MNKLITVFIVSFLFVLIGFICIDLVGEYKTFYFMIASGIICGFFSGVFWLTGHRL